jgi:hypothetical protein
VMEKRENEAGLVTLVDPGSIAMTCSR